MGGGSGGRLSSADIQSLESIAKRRLAEANQDISRHVFISFDHEDLDEVNLLRGQAKNENTDLQFDDHSVKEPYDSTNTDYIKRNIREKIDRCSVTVVYLTEKTVSSRWVNWEIEESLKRGKGVIGVYKGDTPPTRTPPAFHQNKCKAVQWAHTALLHAIEEARGKR